MPVREKQPRRAGSWPARPVLWSRPGSHPRERRAFMPAAMEGTGETDSVLEGRRFEPPVPPEDGAFQNSILSIPQAANRLETELPRPERDRGFESPYLRQRLRL